MERVSIVIVAHDNWPDLELAIQSALRQTHGDIEVIVVDNDSRDATESEVPRRFAGQVRYIRQANRGDSGGYNTGLRAATGDFVQFLDGDDFLAPDKIEKQLEALREDPAAQIAYGDARQFQSKAGTAAWLDIDARQHDDMLAALLTPGAHGAGLMVQGALFRRSALERVGEFDETLYVTDIDYWLRAAALRLRFRHTPGAWWFYRRRPGQMSADPAAIARGLEAVWTKALGYIREEPYRSLLTRHLARFHWHYALREAAPVRQRLRRARLARAQDAAAISLPAYLVGCAVILTPGSGVLLRARFLSPLRRAVGRLLGLL